MRKAVSQSFRWRLGQTGLMDDPAARCCAHVSAADLRPADPTPGMTRRVGLEIEGMWSGVVDTEPHAESDWHHHGEHETTLYVVRGRMRLESGPGGRDVVTASAGDFLHVPARAVHREANPDDLPAQAVIVRCGQGAPTTNVDGPAAGPG